MPITDCVVAVIIIIVATCVDAIRIWLPLYNHQKLLEKDAKANKQNKTKNPFCRTWFVCVCVWLDSLHYSANFFRLAEKIAENNQVFLVPYSGKGQIDDDDDDDLSWWNIFFFFVQTHCHARQPFFRFHSISRLTLLLCRWIDNTENRILRNRQSRQTDKLNLPFYH